MTPLQRFNKWFMASDYPGSMIVTAYEIWTAAKSDSEND